MALLLFNVLSFCYNLNMIVYKATSPSNKVYIGITRFSLAKRKLEHEKSSLKTNVTGLLHRAIKKYGPENIKWEIIDSADSWEDLCNLEIKYISEFESFGKGYNLTKGGDGNTGYGNFGKANGMYGKPSPNRGVRMSKEQKIKIKKSWTIDKKRKLSLRKGGKPFRVIKTKKIPADRSHPYKPARRIDLEIVGIWISQNQCAKDLGFASPCYVNKCLKGTKKTYKNYRFEYLESVDE